MDQCIPGRLGLGKSHLRGSNTVKQRLGYCRARQQKVRKASDRSHQWRRQLLRAEARADEGLQEE